MMNRIQFQAGLSLNDFLLDYGTEAQCQTALENARWPQGFVCPARSSGSFCRVMHGRVKTFQCNRCHKQVTLTGGSIFHSTKLPLTLWFQAMFFLSQNKTNTRARADAPDRCQLPHRLADETQTDAGHV